MKKKANINEGWRTILMLTAIFFFNFMARMIFSPLLPNIEADLGINHAQAGTFFFFIACGYFISLTGSAFVSSMIQHRRLIIFSAMVLGLALPGISFCQDLHAVRMGLLIVGLATGLYLPSAIATLTAGIPPHRWGKAIAIHELAPNMTFILAPVLSEILLRWVSWRGVVSLTGGISLLLGIIFMWQVKDGAFQGDPPGWNILRRIQSDPAFWIMIVLFSLGASGTLGIYAMLPLYLVDGHGMDQTWVNTLFALSRVASLATALVGGWAADRFGIRQTLALTLGLSGMLTILLGVASASWIVVCMFLQPLPAVAFFPAAFASLASIGPAGARNIVISLTVPIAFLMGGGVVPMLIGIMGDAGYFPAGFWITGLLMLAGGGLALRWACCGNRAGRTEHPAIKASAR
jgi:NNP family nitrate/nitrite transporter-like MFS transporter